MKKKFFLPEGTRNSLKLPVALLCNMLPTFSAAKGENKGSVVIGTDHNRHSSGFHDNRGLTVQQQDMARPLADSSAPNITLSPLKLEEVSESLKTA